MQQIKTNQTGNGGHEGIFLFMANFEKNKIIEAKSGARPRRQKRKKSSNHRKVEAELKLQLEEKNLLSVEVENKFPDRRGERRRNERQRIAEILV